MQQNKYLNPIYHVTSERPEWKCQNNGSSGAKETRLVFTSNLLYYSESGYLSSKFYMHFLRLVIKDKTTSRLICCDT